MTKKEKVKNLFVGRARMWFSETVINEYCENAEDQDGMEYYEYDCSVSDAARDLLKDLGIWVQNRI